MYTKVHLAHILRHKTSKRYVTFAEAEALLIIDDENEEFAGVYTEIGDDGEDFYISTEPLRLPRITPDKMVELGLASVKESFNELMLTYLERQSEEFEENSEITEHIKHLKSLIQNA